MSAPLPPSADAPVDPAALARVMANIAAECQRVAGAYWAGQAARSGASPDPLGVLPTLQALQTQWLAHPSTLMRAQTEAMKLYVSLWQRFHQRLWGIAAAPVVTPAAGDRRFRDSEWADNPFFDFVKQSYLIAANGLTRLAQDTPGLDAKTAHKAAFYMGQFADALSPSNFVASNPEVLRATLDSGGRNLIDGLRHLVEDFDPVQGRVRPRMVDGSGFELGRNIATSPGKVVFQNALMQLLQYAPSTPSVKRRPLLIIPPWINKFYVLDLRGENSLVAWLRDQGFTVYLVSWRSAGPEIADFGWEAYFTLAGRAALDWVTWAHGAPANAAGYCVGGVLLAALAARLAEEGDPRLASASLLAAQTDFSEPGDLGLFMDEDTLASIEALIGASGGVMPGEAMREAFDLLRPAELIWKYAEERYLLGRPAPAFDLLHWNGDQTNIPGPLHLHALRELYRDNALARGRFSVEGRPVDLSSIAAPVFLQASLRDHISPAASVLKAARLLSCEVTAIVCDSGHIAGVVNPPSAGKYRYWAGDPGAARRLSLGAWLDEAGETPGSWWPMWADWLHARSGGWRPPPPPDPDAPPAPGAYVLETLDDIRPRFRTPQGGARG